MPLSLKTRVSFALTSVFGPPPLQTGFRVVLTTAVNLMKSGFDVMKDERPKGAPLRPFYKQPI